MITDINSEDRLVQQTFAAYLHDALGWESVYAWNEYGRSKTSRIWGMNASTGSAS